MGKNIVVFSDGTGKEGGVGANTNVYKLFNMVLDRSPEQVAFYDRGLGTGWRKLTGNVGGGGISRNIQECYRFIFDQFEADDRIFLFGFSRGAATVRSLSGFLHLFGILPKSRPELIPRAYKIYRITGEGERRARAKAFLASHHNMWCRIKVLGVWDTVAALGLPSKALDVVVDKIPFWKHSFHNLRLSPSVENGYQALALDDERRTFHPVLWDAEIAPDQTMEQVWFAGMHSDVGGGYPEHALSDIALQWIVQKAVGHGLRIYPKHAVSFEPDPHGTMHDSRGSGVARLYRRGPRTWNTGTHGRPTIHESVLQRHQAEAGHGPYKPWILNGTCDCRVEAWRRTAPWWRP